MIMQTPHILRVGENVVSLFFFFLSRAIATPRFSI